MELKDWTKSINNTKNNLIDEDPSLEREYSPFIINKIFSGFIDSIIYANEMNKNHFLDKKLQYDFLINTLRIRSRFTPWISKDKISELESIKKYYGYSNEKAHQALKILSKQQIEFIKSKFELGGSK